MPELPEVETIRGDLATQLVGRRFAGAEIFWERTVALPDAVHFAEQLAGHSIAAVDRRGKFLVLRLDGDAALVVHLRMTGRLRLRPHGAERSPHLRALLFLAD